MSNCAIIVPIRNRKNQLEIFLKKVPDYILNTNKYENFHIFITEQEDDSEAPFNLALADNIGALFASKHDEYTHFVFNELDVIPVKNIDYSLIKNEMGMMNWGTFRVEKNAFFSVNGYNNIMFGWCCDDWDFLQRLDLFGFPYENHFDSAIQRRELGDWEANEYFSGDIRGELKTWRTEMMTERNLKIRNFFWRLCRENKEMAKEWTRTIGVSNINPDKIRHIETKGKITHLKYKSYDYV
jgi:hypothetical protein